FAAWADAQVTAIEQATTAWNATAAELAAAVGISNRGFVAKATVSNAAGTVGIQIADGLRDLISTRDGVLEGTLATPAAPPPAGPPPTPMPDIACEHLYTLVPLRWTEDGKIRTVAKHSSVQLPVALAAIAKRANVADDFGAERCRSMRQAFAESY